MKHKIAFFIGFIFLASQIFFAPAVNAEGEFFKDVPKGSDYFTAIQYLKKADLLDKNGDLFDTGKEMSRAEAVYYILKIILGYAPESNMKLTLKPFLDVPAESILAPYIKTAVELKIINGYENKKFLPHKRILLAEAIKMVLETEKLINNSIVFSAPAEESAAPEISTAAPAENIFADVPANVWFAPYAKLAREKRIIKFGKSDEMEPSEIVTKGYLMEILYRLIRSREGINFGIASYYHKTLEGGHTSSGESFSNKNFTAAHRKLPFGTRVRVTNLRNSKTVEVVINDRGPYAKNFTLDLSQAAFSSIAPLSNGIIPIEYLIIQ
ncbi:septal ring lytic transglycosylase RlpA family protein [Candidatus Peregrinibacteria bacterium]|nr:septal ring lytic transglycosylase RlpA family protein [Candidatus Peregrinibacteria bacterium]